MPTPRPADDIGFEHASIYPTTDNQELMAVLEACLSSPFLLYRAQEIFKNLRMNSLDPSKFQSIDVKIYNKVIERYLFEASKSTKPKMDKWVNEAFSLWYILDEGSENVSWDINTWYVMLKGISRLDSNYDLKPLIKALNNMPNKPSLVELLLNFDQFHSKNEIFQIISVLTKSAASSGNASLIEDLSHIHKRLEISMDEDVNENNDINDNANGIQNDDEPDVLGVISPSSKDTPYNLYSLRQSLKPLSNTSKTLANDPATRQKLLEESAYETAKARFEHEIRELEKAGVATALSAQPLQKLMWNWWKKITIDITNHLNKDRSLTELKTKEDRFLSMYILYIFYKNRINNNLLYRRYRTIFIITCT